MPAASPTSADTTVTTAAARSGGQPVAGGATDRCPVVVATLAHPGSSPAFEPAALQALGGAFAQQCPGPL